MILDALLSGLWVCPERRCLAAIFTLDHVSLSSFTALVLFTSFRATRLCRCLLQSVRVKAMPWRLLFVVSEILVVGNPGFCIELCCFPHPLNWPLWFCGVSCFICFLVRACVIVLTGLKAQFDAAQPDVQRHSSAFLDAELLEGTMVNFPRPLDLTACCHSPPYGWWYSNNLKRTKRRSERHPCLGVDAPFQLKN